MKLKKEIRNKINEIAEVAGYLWEKGWAERNAGNISVNVTALFEKENQDFGSHHKVSLNWTYNALEGKTFIVSGTGTRMRELAKHPQKNICIIRLIDNGSSYQVLCDNHPKLDLRPTSELPTHLAIHQMLLEKRAKEEVVLHTHVDELIALSQIKEYQDTEKLNHLIWGMHPEAMFFIPEGIGYIPYQLPGSQDMAMHTIKSLQDHKVVLWQKHGCIAIGENVHEAFDKIDIVAKSARIFFYCKNAGYDAEGLTEMQFNEIRNFLAKGKS